MEKWQRREILQGSLLAGALTSFGAMPSLARAAASVQDLGPLMASVNPELRKYVPAILAWSEGPPLQQRYKQVRQQAEAGIPAPLPDVPLSTQKIAVPDQSTPVTAYVINAGGSNRPAILHTHGGGFVMGLAKAEIPAKQAMAKALDCCIVTVEYTLAPEAIYAVSVEQNYAALKWLHDNAASLGVDRSRIAVMGESAGGGHAALLAIAARDRGEVPLAFQCLIYPMLDDRTGSTCMPTGEIGQMAWTPAANRFGWRSFLGRPPGGNDVPVRAVPARTASLAGLPPAFIGVGSIDLFVNEDVTYARRLIDDGIETGLHVIPGAFHGFDGVAPDTSIARQFTLAKMNALRRAFGLPLDSAA